jgi:hypothetical protein
LPAGYAERWQRREMITNSELAELSEADLHYALSVANIEGAQLLCTGMIDKTFSATFSHASVISSLLHHGVELFLKYAISRSGGKVPTHHYIRGLLKEYNAAYQGDKYSLELPFITQHLGYTEAEIKVLIKKEQHDKNRTDQMARYHVDRTSKPWEGIQAFSPTSFLDVIEVLSSRLNAVRENIEACHCQQFNTPDPRSSGR